VATLITAIWQKSAREPNSYVDIIEFTSSARRAIAFAAFASKPHYFMITHRPYY
jgi:hypothetical protein